MATSGKINLRVIKAIRDALRENGVSEDGLIMQAYMKSDMPNRGVKTPVMRRIVKDCDARFPCQSVDDLQATVLELFRKAAYREERHAAIDLTRQKRYSPWLSPRLMPLFEELITTGAWWDLVDAIAPYRIAELLKSHPTVMRKKMLTWGRAKDIWKRRTSIICQLKFKEETDEELLFTNIRESMGEPEFFLRKGIGWALREYGKCQPDVVLKFVRENQHALSRLSKREALRRILSKDELASLL